MPENTYVCTRFPHLVMNMNNARRHVCMYEVSTLMQHMWNFFPPVLQLVKHKFLIFKQHMWIFFSAHVDFIYIFFNSFILFKLYKTLLEYYSISATTCAAKSEMYIINIYAAHVEFFPTCAAIGET